MFSIDPFKNTKLPLLTATTTTIAKARTTTTIKTKITRIATTKMITTTTVTPYTYVDKNLLEQRFSTAGTRPGTGTWRPSYRDLNYFGNLKIHQIQHKKDINY